MQAETQPEISFESKSGFLFRHSGKVKARTWKLDRIVGFFCRSLKSSSLMDVRRATRTVLTEDFLEEAVLLNLALVSSNCIRDRSKFEQQQSGQRYLLLRPQKNCNGWRYEVAGRTDAADCGRNAPLSQKSMLAYRIFHQSHGGHVYFFCCLGFPQIPCFVRFGRAGGQYVRTVLANGCHLH
jgi:hypothetical protein